MGNIKISSNCFDNMTSFSVKNNKKEKESITITSKESKEENEH